MPLETLLANAFQSAAELIVTTGSHLTMYGLPASISTASANSTVSLLFARLDASLSSFFMMAPARGDAAICAALMLNGRQSVFHEPSLRNVLPRRHTVRVMPSFWAMTAALLSVSARLTPGMILRVLPSTTSISSPWTKTSPTMPSAELLLAVRLPSPWITSVAPSGTTMPDSPLTELAPLRMTTASPSHMMPET